MCVCVCVCVCESISLRSADDRSVFHGVLFHYEAHPGGIDHLGSSRLSARRHLRHGLFHAVLQLGGKTGFNYYKKSSWAILKFCVFSCNCSSCYVVTLLYHCSECIVGLVENTTTDKWCEQIAVKVLVGNHSAQKKDFSTHYGRQLTVL